jgi:hypothetical protein
MLRASNVDDEAQKSKFYTGIETNGAKTERK